MKQLYVLLGGVGLLLVAWFWMGPKPVVPTFAVVEVPKDATDVRAISLGVGQLWAAEAGHFDPLQVLSYLRLLAEKLDDRAMGMAAAPALYAWRNHRLMPELRPKIQALNEILLPRVLALGSMEEFEGLIRAANEKAWDAELLERHMMARMQAPLKELEGSGHALLIAAAVRSDDLPRAMKMLERLTWIEDALGAQRTIADQAASAVRFLLAQRSGLKDASTLVRHWAVLWEGPLGPPGFCPALEDLVLSMLKTDIRAPGVPTLEKLVADSSGEPGADRFWGRVAGRFAGHLIHAAPLRTQNYAELLDAMATAFPRPGFAYPLWMRAAELTDVEVPDDPLRAVQYYRKAVACAVSDTDRALTVRRAATLYLSRLEFAQARQIIEETLVTVKDPAVKKEFQPLLQDLLKKQALDGRRVEIERKDVEDTRKRGTLDHFRENLKMARKRKAPAAEIANLERVIKDLERQLTE